MFGAAPTGPSFTVIDAIEVGNSWPQLRAALEIESPREILSALLAPSPIQVDSLKEQDGWLDEAREFLVTTLGLSLKTKGKNLGPVADELWRFLLFSEFAFDLPGDLPETLRNVPRAPAEAKPIVLDVCEALRSGKASIVYIERGETVEKDLDLAARCKGITDLGERETFPFEERAFLQAAIRAVVAEDLDGARAVLKRHATSVWRGKGESLTQWELVRSGLALVEACDALATQLPDHTKSQADLINFYLHHLREADRLHREFEQAVGGLVDLHDAMHDVISYGRSRYRSLAEKVQVVFMKHLETSGWPPQGRLANADVFDKFVAERLKENGRKVAYMMVDALRYELGLALERMLAEDSPVELQAAYAQLPTVTPVGMASLLPSARSELFLRNISGSLQPNLAGTPVNNVTQRMEVVQSRYGDRFKEMQLSEFVRSKPKVPPAVELLVLRSTEIDSQLESNPETALSLIPGTLNQIRVAVHKLRGLGFTDVVIAADHGFFLNASAEAGDVCLKPAGNWPVNAHDRILLGSGPADVHSAVIPTERIGIRGDFESAAMPRSMAPYRAGVVYFHGGASLAEAVVPILTMRLKQKQEADRSRIAIGLSYKSGAKRITTLVPVIEVSATATDMFASADIIQLLLEAHDQQGNVVGEPRPSADVDPATRTITLIPGQKRQITMRMDQEFEGKFTVKAIDPTSQAIHCSLILETDYTR